MELFTGYPVMWVYFGIMFGFAAYMAFREGR